MLNPHLDDGDIRVYLADCIDAMRQLPADSVDAIVTDPPYGLEFMGKEWDSFGRDTGPGYREKPRFTSDHMGKGFDKIPNSYQAGRPFQAFSEAWAREALRIAKPGAHLAAFGGTRTYHRLAAGIEDAGWEIRDCLAWMYGSGFPKSLDVSKAIDKAAGAEREVVGERTRGTTRPPAPDQSRGVAYRYGGDVQDTAPATPAAAEWAGWGTALKPAYEPVILARKPLAGTVAANVLQHGTGALNIDATRIGHASEADLAASLAKNPGRGDKVTSGVYGADRPQQSVNTAGRWPANVVLDPHAAALLDAQSGERPGATSNSSRTTSGLAGTSTFAIHERERTAGRGDSGGASRFFYTAKADAEERVAPDGTRIGHPTLKPTDLMRWLVRLVTPPGGLVLDPFAGSGSTGVACRAEGFRCVLIEREDEYAAYIRARLSQPTLFTEECRNG